MNKLPIPILILHVGIIDRIVIFNYKKTIIYIAAISYFLYKYVQYYYPVINYL